ncbi:zinc finger protein 831 isoform X1 [Eumetopias jubatus]|uniref:zinc finger protein 831 isoform X1 n=1 Tax=Eumetopias jubatus TaxID=34886 RepID=UPI0010163CE0|nr:zinc finger protein 831 isoform X1 [Eumetopias jubatus]XP_027944917.1 zinc finger protein 831 isoform X1 [Eumetopias jubatus]XP_027944918.1 zinc finger protein 831 isoform X1 [Eumetopias jubatus]
MEVPELTRAFSPAGGQPALAPRHPGAPGGQVSSHLTLGPVILPPEQGLAPTVFLKALPIPLYHTVPPGGLQPRAPPVTHSLDGGSIPFILSPLLRPEGPGPTQAGKPVAPALTVNIVGTLPVLSPGLGPTLGSPGKVRNAGKYLCPHCGRDCLKPSVLEKHIRSHTGERPFPCATCGIAFKTQSNLYKHRRTQTHLNHSRLSSESDGGGGSLLEEGDKAGESSRADGMGDSSSQRVGGGARSERPLSVGTQGAGHCPAPAMPLSSVAKTLGLKLEAVPCPGSTFADRETPVDSAHTASPGPALAGSQPRWKLPEQTSPTASRLCSLQQQQVVTSSEKPWDAKALEGRLRKCESTDSGYLSRSDSAEQPPAPGSPLHSLSGHSAESEVEVALGPGGPSLQLEKKQLEERIAWLISHNQAVVDDSQLDNVRPRKTVLCKQGSIDLPMPYTYKDSFHFDIRALQPGRRKPAALSSARSTFTPPDKAQPLFFHSVPTQLSTTVACVPITRSNSLPFVEGTRTWQEPLGPQDACPRRQKPLSPRPAPAQLVNVPSGHPRALVRQAAVEDLPCPPTGDSLVPAEDSDRNRAAAGVGAASKGRAGSKKCSQRKLKMFSQDKWQVYGNETFKRIYQKMKTSCHGGKKAREMTLGSGTELALPLQEELAGNEGTVPFQDRRTPVHGDTAVGAKPGPCQSPLAPEGFLVMESPKQREMVVRAGGSDQPRVNRATSPPTLSCREPPCLGSKSPLLSPNGRLELGCQLPPAPGPLRGGDLEAPKLILPDPKMEEGTSGGGDKKETCQWTQTVPRRPSGSSGEPQPSEDKLPSERKKLKVEKLSCQEQSEPLGTEREAPGGPVQATSPPSQNQDCDPGDKPGELHESADGMARGRAGQPSRPLELSGAPSAAPSVALRQVGLREEILPCPRAASLGHQSHLATQAPGVLAALADTAFPPKYLLRLPQEETHPPPPVALGPGQGQDPVCRRRWPEQQASFVGSGLGTLLPPCPASGLAPSGADSFQEDPSCSRPWGRRKRVQGEEKGYLDTGTPAAGQSHGSSNSSPRETASFLPTPTCATWKSGPPDTRHLCAGSTVVGAKPSGGVLSPCALSRELGPPENAPEDPPSGPLAGLSSCHSFLTAPTPPSWPELALCTHSETLWSFRAHGPFPSLRAEPRLTWCCLSRSLPLPTEQKEKAASVYLALHFLGGSAQDKGPDARPVSRAVVGGWTKTGLGEGGQVQTSKLSCPVASGMVSQPEWKKGPPWRKVKMFRGSGKQKLSIRSRRYKGSFLQSRVQPKGGGPRRPPRVLRKDRHLPPLEGLGPRGTCRQPSSEMAGLNLQEEPSCASSESPVGCGHREKEEEGSRQTSGSFSPSTSSRAGSGIDHVIMKVISPAAGGCSDCHYQNTAAGSGQSERPGSCVAVGTDRLLSPGGSLSLGLLETRPLPSQEQVSVDMKPYISSDAQEPSSFESKGTSPCQDVAPSVAAICSLGERAGHTTLGIHGAEPQAQRAAGEALTQSSSDRKAKAEGMSPPVLPGRPSSEQRISGLVLLGSTGKTRLEIPASGAGSASSYQEEGEHKMFSPTGVQEGHGEMVVPCPPLGNESGKCRGSGLTALKDRVVPSNPGQHRESPEFPSKTVKRRGLEGLRKQTRVEVSDTSSDDEDRLVIEM